MTFEQAHATIKDLILNFQKNENHYLSPTYSEAEVRQEYIDPFFTALGWDVGSKINKNPHEREVVIEKTQSQEDSFSKKRADYAFYIAPNFKKEVFFVEAKKPSRTLRLNKEDYFQTAKYGYNSGTGISILFDFEEFVMIDCRFKPDKDTVLATQIKYYKYTDFLEEEAFSEIYFLFSRMAVAEGKLQNYISNLPTPKKVSKSRQLKLNIAGLLTIDQDFLNFVEEARVNIAQAIYNNHPQLKNYELTEAVQKILDRLVFIRFLEDKSIEAEYIIQKMHTSPYPWNKFVEESKRLESKYNSIVFKKAFFDKDDFLDKNNTYFNETIIDFLASESPYNFNYIPIEIIGNIYERFLGKTIEIEDNKVKIDLKPAVRKAGGVFYTPSYIVDYIIQNTIGKQIENKTPKEVSKLTFADISCGSGSFLIGIFDHLIQYHQNYYFNHPAEAEKEGCLYDEEMATWKLSLNQKKQILLNNVYGVDIDHQATEVAQMSLLLKLLEHENLFTTSKQQSLFMADKILPTLSENIKSGNSLIGKDVVFQGKMKFDNYEEELKINPFDFEPAFPKVFKNGGFDAIVGNPPYVNVENLDKSSKEYYFNKYKTCKGRTDIYIAFIEKSMELLNKNGQYSVIIPFAYTNQNYGALSRNLILNKYFLEEITDTSDYFVFKDAIVKNIILFTNKSNLNNKLTRIVKYQSEEHFRKNESISFTINPAEFLKLKECRFETKNITYLNKIKDKITSNSVNLERICYVAYGARLNHKTEKINKSNYIHFNYEEGLKPFVEGKNIKRYDFEQNGWLNYKPEEHYNSMFKELFENEKLMCINVVSNRIRFAYDNSNFYNSHTIVNCILLEKLANCNYISAKKAVELYGIEESKKYTILLILGILNSNLINWYFFNFQSESLHFYPNDIKQLPIPKEIHKENKQKMITLVEQMLESKKREKEATSDREKEYIADHIKSLDYQIDNLVYEMYGLSDDEREVVESGK
jgi:adenine-specific DNA-methyltransferase